MQTTPNRLLPRVLCAALALLLTALPATAEDLFANRPAFAPPEQRPSVTARCDQVRAMAEGLPVLETRIDLWVAGALTLVRTDGALWYLVICDDLRIMCVTYESNDMQVGERVVMRGGYRRLDPRHAVLDPCLASREDAE
jgi:hypothetical protein